MKQLAKDILGDVRKSVVNLLVATVGPILWASAATAAWWGPRLSLTDSQVSSIRFWLVFVGATALIAVAWGLYLRCVRKVQRLERELIEAQKRPHCFQDDCIPDERLGLYRHKTKASFFCGSCTPKDIESPLKAEEYGWRCQIKECGKFHANPDKRMPQPLPFYRSPLDGSMG